MASQQPVFLKAIFPVHGEVLPKWWIQNKTVCLSNMFQEETYCKIHWQINTIFFYKKGITQGDLSQDQSLCNLRLGKTFWLDWAICWPFRDMLLINSCVPKVLELIYYEARQHLLKECPHFMKNVNSLFLQDPEKVTLPSHIVQPSSSFLWNY